jgi:phage protein D
LSNVDALRRTKLTVKVNGVDISEDVNKHLISATFTDLEDGASDDLEIVLEDRDNLIVGKWLNQEMNKRGAVKKKGKKEKNATIEMRITQQNWKGDGKDISLNCGKFQLDEVSMKGPPQTVTLRGTACSFSSGIRKRKITKAWKNTTLQNIAKSIGKQSGYSVMYLAQKQIKYKRRDQRKSTNIVFLQKLCRADGLSLKVTNSTLVIFDQKTKESADSKRKIKRGDGSYSSYSFETSLSEKAYSACKVSYKKTNGKKIKYTYVPKGGKLDKKNLLEVTNEKVDSTAEAKSLAIARLREANKGETTANFTMPGDITAYAGLTIQTSGWGAAYDQKYIIEESKHSISKSGGFRTSIKARQVIKGY